MVCLTRQRVGVLYQIDQNQIPDHCRCVHLLLQCNGLPQTKWLKLTHMQLLFHSFMASQEPGEGLAVFSSCSQNLDYTAFSSAALTGEASTSAFTQVVGRFHFLSCLLFHKHFVTGLLTSESQWESLTKGRPSHSFQSFTRLHQAHKGHSPFDELKMS